MSAARPLNPWLLSLDPAERILTTTEFTADASAVSLGLRLAQNDIVSHAQFLWSPSGVYDPWALSLCSHIKPGFDLASEPVASGVALRHWNYIKATRRIRCQVMCPRAVLVVAAEEIGFGYDWLGLVDFIRLGRGVPWTGPLPERKRICSEHVGFAFPRGGYPILNDAANLWAITPRDLRRFGQWDRMFEVDPRRPEVVLWMRERCGGVYIDVPPGQWHNRLRGVA